MFVREQIREQKKTYVDFSPVSSSIGEQDQ